MLDNHKISSKLKINISSIIIQVLFTRFATSNLNNKTITWHFSLLKANYERCDKDSLTHKHSHKLLGESLKHDNAQGITALRRFAC